MKQSCRKCRGSGVDPKANYRHTSGGHDDRSCSACNGTGEREFDECRNLGLHALGGVYDHNACGSVHLGLLLRETSSEADQREQLVETAEKA